MINLANVQEEKLTYEKLIKRISEYDIYAYYIGNFSVGRSLNSPFRKDDSPSFGIYVGSRGNLIFNDFKFGAGNCIKFVMLMENCSWQDAYHILNHRYKLGYNTYSDRIKSLPITKEVIITDKRDFERVDKWIDIKIKPWTIDDKEYWSSYNISLSTLQKFNVFSIEKFYINNRLFKCSRLAYAYRYDVNVYKIYQPLLSVKDGKWFSNIKNNQIYQGEDQLPETGELLFITSSLKDVMVLYECGYNAVAPHTEHQILSIEKYENYKKRFNRIVVFYDNDEAGILHANKMKDQFNLECIYVPDEKDPSDFVKKYNLETLKVWIIENSS